MAQSTPNDSAPTPEVLPLANGVELRTAALRVSVQFVTENIVHVVRHLPEVTARPASLIVLPREEVPLGIQTVKTDSTLTLSSSRLRAKISLQNFEVSFQDMSGLVLLSGQGGGTITPVQIEHETRAAFTIKESFNLSADEGIYGLGQHQNGEMNYRNRTVVLVQANTQSAIPLFTSSRGYGVLWDNYSKTIFSDSPTGASMWSEVADAIDYYFINGGTIDGVVAGYRDLTGAAPMYGRWAYGYWQSKEHYEDRAELLKVAAEYRAKQIPIDGIIQDWDYWDGRENWSQLFFWDKLFPKPEEMIDILHKQNYHFMVSIWCGFGPNTPVYKEMDKQGCLLPTVGWAGFKYFDPHNPKGTDLYWKFTNEGLFSKGVDGWWMDSTEPDIVNAQTKEAQEYEMKRTGTCHLGSFARYLNTYPLMSTEAVYKNQRKTTDQKRVYILTRSVFAGQQRAAATTWTGDIGANWDIYRYQISSGVNHGMSGVPYWTFDIGAFVIGSYGGVFCDGGKDPAYQELYTRMFQLGAFSPIFRSHGSETPREIWEFGPFSQILEKYDHLRYRLMPYIYSLAWQVTHRSGTIMRGLPMDFAADRRTYGIDDQFMFGPALLVSPVTEYQLHRPPSPSVEMQPENFRTLDGRPGLDVTYYGDDQWTRPVSKGTESTVNLYWYTGWPKFVETPKFSMHWVGKLIPTESGPHRFHVKCFGPKILLIDGKQVTFNYQSTEAYTVPMELVAGREYSFEFKTSNAVLGAFKAQIRWKTPTINAAEKIRETRKQTRTVYLPADTQWFDFWTGQIVPGGQTIETPAPIDTLPLNVRAGSIIPMGPFLQFAAEKPADPIELRVYPGADGDFELYEDENDNYNYEKGAYATIGIHWSNTKRELTFAARKGSFPGMLERRTFNVVLVAPLHGTGAEVSATPDQVVAYTGAAQTVQF